MKGEVVAFDRDQVADLLAKCHRRCCICHRFCGFKMETDHMNPAGEGGDDNIDNALPVCFECHSEIHCYNTDHPRGRKFTVKELRAHKEQWLNICANNPEIFSQSFQSSDAGPLNSLIDELEYNIEACKCLGSLSTSQFDEALRKGAISLLEPALKDKINRAYAKISLLNKIIDSPPNISPQGKILSSQDEKVAKYKPGVITAIQDAHDCLLSFLQKDSDNKN